ELVEVALVDAAERALDGDVALLELAQDPVERIRVVERLGRQLLDIAEGDAALLLRAIEKRRELARRLGRAAAPSLARTTRLRLPRLRLRAAFVEAARRRLLCRRFGEPPRRRPSGRRGLVAFLEPARRRTCRCRRC